MCERGFTFPYTQKQDNTSETLRIRLEEGVEDTRTELSFHPLRRAYGGSPPAHIDAGTPFMWVCLWATRRMEGVNLKYSTWTHTWKIPHTFKRAETEKKKKETKVAVQIFAASWLAKGLRFEDVPEREETGQDGWAGTKSARCTWSWRLPLPPERDRNAVLGLSSGFPRVSYVVAPLPQPISVFASYKYREDN